VPCAQLDTARGNRDIDGLGLQHASLGLGLENALTLGQSLVQPTAGGAEELAGGGPVGLVQGPDAPAGSGQGGGVAGKGQASLLESGQVAGDGNGGQPLLDEGGDARFIQRRQRVSSVSHPGAFR
jgi:hypothetical protein